MGLRIQTNITSMGANRQLSAHTNERGRTIQRLSSGERITSAGDDAAGLSISEKLRSGIRSMQMASRNTQDGISVVQTAEGGIVEAQNILIRLRELSTQAASDTVGPAERSFLDQEFQQLKSEVTRIANTTVYNGTQLLNGTAVPMEFQVGIENDSFGDRVIFAPEKANLTAPSLGIAGARVDTKEMARNNFTAIDSAISRLGDFRSYLGAIQSNLVEHSHGLETHRQNLAATNSRMRDTDYAEWTARQIQLSILQETNVAVVAQANATAQSAVKLLEKA